MFCVLFGLSMDYHIFLLSRISERYAEHGDTREAVVFGVGSTAGIITGAALIMVAVFAGVAMGEMTMFQQLGFGLAVAIAIDATVVRTVVVPSAMALLGSRSWYLPKWLQWLPRMSIDPASRPQIEDDLAEAPQGGRRRLVSEQRPGARRAELRAAGTEFEQLLAQLRLQAPDLSLHLYPSGASVLLNADRLLERRHQVGIDLA